MINDYTIIKLSRKVLGDNSEYWPRRVRYIKNHLEEMKLGFPGIGNSHMSFKFSNDLVEGDIFILDYSLIQDDLLLNIPPVMFRYLGGNKFFIEGIGKGLHASDPDRLFRWKDTIEIDILPPLVLSVDVKPTDNGGPGYYYFFKSYRDFRI